MVADFMRNFDRNFKRALQEEKRLLLRRSVSRILVDRQNYVAQAAVRRLPAVIPEIADMLEKIGKKALTTKVAGAARSGDRTFRFCEVTR